MVPKVLIPVGYGLNCEEETAYAFEMVGASVEKVFFKDLTQEPLLLEKYHILALIGGFSFGDHIAAGKVMANFYRFKLKDEIHKFIEEEKLIYGECNGFQVLVKAGILPDMTDSVQRVTLTYNDSGIFEDRWVRLSVNHDTNCVFTTGIDELFLPVRHGEGKFVIQRKSDLWKLKKENQIVLQYADMNNQPTMEYPLNPNGSVEAIAGICDRTGRVFGKMPHATAYLSPYNHPHWTRLKIEGQLPDEGGGVQIFRNAVEYVKTKLL
ncbi:MAG: phosphoribosylformylglycinamidine synthase subunit PurQ [Candidatus Bathyarchaeota archaeon]|nr:MAG: phosphoribosylformylglycinamidine synthase subunit PurQ [Candidatus Bathyarchaeota archaeon]